MKRTLTTFIIIATIGLMATGFLSCRKTTDSPDIKTYDQQQITAYLQNNNLTGYSKDLNGGDTSGIYYKILKQGSGNALDYSDQVFFVFTVRTLDGAYSSADTTVNHAYSYVGHLSPAYTPTGYALPFILPSGLQIAFKNLIKYRGTQAKVIIPSHLAFGTAGVGSGSNRIAGNQSLEYYVNVVDPSAQATYDDALIQKYIANNGLSGFTKSSSGLYYKVTSPGTGTNYATSNSTISIQFAGKYMNNNVFDTYTASDSSGVSRDFASIPKGWQEGFQKVTKGGTLSLIVPSALGYGLVVSNPYGFSNGGNGVISPTPNCVLYYDFTIESIKN